MAALFLFSSPNDVDSETKEREGERKQERETARERAVINGKIHTHVHACSKRKGDRCVTAATGELVTVVT